jgi:hypothetical protein
LEEQRTKKSAAGAKAAMPLANMISYEQKDDFVRPYAAALKDYFGEQ